MFQGSCQNFRFIKNLLNFRSFIKLFLNLLFSYFSFMFLILSDESSVDFHRFLFTNLSQRCFASASWRRLSIFFNLRNFVTKVSKFHSFFFSSNWFKVKSLKHIVYLFLWSAALNTFYKLMFCRLHHSILVLPFVYVKLHSGIEWHSFIRIDMRVIFIKLLNVFLFISKWQLIGHAIVIVLRFGSLISSSKFFTWIFILEHRDEMFWLFWKFCDELFSKSWLLSSFLHWFVTPWLAPWLYNWA